MDYMTKPISRATLRGLAPYVRKLFGILPTGSFPVLEALEKVPDVFEGSSFAIVEDMKMPKTTPARCTLMEGGGFLIEIQESVYRGAYENHTGAYLGFICHEICHLFLFKMVIHQFMRERSKIIRFQLTKVLNGRLKRYAEK